MQKNSLFKNNELYNNVSKRQYLKYGQFAAVLYDIIAIKHDIKPLAEIYCTSVDEYEKFSPILEKEELYVKCTSAKRKGAFDVYISKNKQLVDNCIDKKFDRSNSALFGKRLGFPSCCVKKLPLLSKRLKNSKNIIKAQFYLNNLLTTISNFCLSFHYPCSYHCQKTISYNKKIFAAIAKEDPECASLIERWLKVPLLTWQHVGNLDYIVCVIFDGVAINDNTIIYKKCCIGFTNQIKNISSFFYFKLGDKVIVERNNIKIFRNNSLIKSLVQKQPYRIFLYNFF